MHVYTYLEIITCCFQPDLSREFFSLQYTASHSYAGTSMQGKVGSDGTILLYNICLYGIKSS